MHREGGQALAGAAQGGLGCPWLEVSKEGWRRAGDEVGMRNGSDDPGGISDYGIQDPGGIFHDGIQDPEGISQPQGCWHSVL